MRETTDKDLFMDLVLEIDGADRCHHCGKAILTIHSTTYDPIPKATFHTACWQQWKTHGMPLPAQRSPKP